MKYTKISALVLALTMLLGLLAGCGAGTANPSAVESSGSAVQEEMSNTAAPEETEEPASVAPEKAGIQYPVGNGEVITFVTNIDGNILSMVEGQVLENFHHFKALEAATGVTFDCTALTTMDSSAMSLIFASSDYPDIFATAPNNYTTGASGLLEDDIILDLMPYLEEYAPDYAGHFAAAGENYQKSVLTDDGRLGGIYSISNPIQRTEGLALRADWFQELNIPAPETYDELERTLLGMLENHPSTMYPMLFNNGYEMASLGYGFGLDFSAASGCTIVDEQVQYNIAAEGFRSYLEYLSRLVTSGLINTDLLLSGSDEQGVNMWTSGNVFLSYGGSDNMAQSLLDLAEDPGFDMMALADPVVKKGCNSGLGLVVPNGQYVWSVSTQAENAELVVSVINWFFTDEGIESCNWGTENEAFVYDAEGNKQFTDLVLNNPDGIPNWMAKFIFTSFETPTIMPDEAVYAQFTRQAMYDAVELWPQNRSNEHTYFGNLTVEESLSIGSIVADLETTSEEYAYRFIVGELELNDASWNAYVAALESLDIQKVIDTYQAAYNRYQA